MNCARRHAKRRYAIYCFANLLLCFQVELGWFDEPASSTFPLKIAISRFVGWHFVLLEPHHHGTLPELRRRSDDVLKSLWARCDSRTPQRLRSICSSGVLLLCDVNRNKHPGDFWEQTSEASRIYSTDIKPAPELDCELSLLFSNRAMSLARAAAGVEERAKSGRWAMSRMAFFGFARFGEKSGDSSQSRSRHLLEKPGNLAWRLPGIALNRRVYWAVILRNGNKDPSNLFTMFILHEFLVITFQYSKCERVMRNDSSR